jgi:hypothetical protein
VHGEVLGTDNLVEVWKALKEAEKEMKVDLDNSLSESVLTLSLNGSGRHVK